jgi:ADP-heptose:LPS heptosyltransferase
MKTIAFYNDFHLGDQMALLLFLRKLSVRYPDIVFQHYMPGDYISQMLEVIADMPNVRVYHIDHRPAGAINGWIGSGHDELRAKHPGGSNEYVAFYLDWYRILAARAGLESPMQCVTDMLYDYPTILKPTCLSQRINVLVLNSRPLSGQYRDYSADHYVGLIRRLCDKGYRVAYTENCPAPSEAVSTAGANLSVTGIGNLSLDCDYIMGVATGPMWPTINIWNQMRVKGRFHLSTDSTLAYGPAYHDFKTFDAMSQELRNLGIL